MISKKTATLAAFIVLILLSACTVSGTDPQVMDEEQSSLVTVYRSPT